MPAASDEVETGTPSNDKSHGGEAVTTSEKAAVEVERTSAVPEPRKSKEEENEPVSESSNDEEEGPDELVPASEKEHAEILRRKRDREGSLEPSLSSQQGVSTPDAIPTKKNRLQDSVIGEEQAPALTSAVPSSPNHKGGEGEKVGQIRKRVQDLSWKQRKEGDRDRGEEDPEVEEEGEEAAEDTQATSEKEEKRMQPSFSSFSSKPSAFAASASKNDGSNFLSSTSTSAPEEQKKPSSPTSAGRTQPTFSSFSKSSSPFNSASSVAGPSWLAGKSGSGSTASPGGGIRPSALGSVGSPTDSAEASASVTPPEKEKAATSAATTSTGSRQLGFGAFTNSKSFGSRNSTPAATSEKTVKGDGSDEDSKGKTFDEVLKQGEDKDNGVEANKVSTQLDRGQADLRTGEEDEKALISARAKLFTMAEDKSWKERGTGTVRCNVGKDKGGAARLVMRSEGVLRLILNVNLFKGMKINLEQDKFLRIVAMEDGKLVHFAIKFANPLTAGNFYQVVKHTIPAQQGEEQA